MSDSAKLDKMLGKLHQFKEELEKAKVKVNLGVVAKKGKTATNEYVDAGPKFKKGEDASEKWKETKKAEFLAMTKSGQWTLEVLEKAKDDRAENAKPYKHKKEKEMPLTPEKSSEHNAPKGEPYAGSGKDRMGKAEDEPHKDDPHHEEKEKEIADEIKGKAKEFLDMHHGKEEPHEDDPRHEAKEKKAAKDIKSKAKKIKDLHKMDDATTMAGPVSSYDAVKMDEGGPMSGDAIINDIEKKDSKKK